MHPLLIMIELIKYISRSEQIYAKDNLEIVDVQVRCEFLEMKKKTFSRIVSNQYQIDFFSRQTDAELQCFIRSNGKVLLSSLRFEQQLMNISDLLKK